MSDRTPVERNAPTGRLLIVNADDLGLHEDINRGIRRAHTAGIVTSTSLVACGEAFDDAVKVVQDCPELDVGVHLTLVEERPLCPVIQVRSLVGRDGRFLPSYRHLAARMLMGGLSTEEVHRELRAQVERVIMTGRHPSHIDGHQHAHLLPKVWGIATRLAREHGVRWIRVPRFDSVLASRKSPLDPFFRLGLNSLSAARAGTAPRIRTSGLHLSGRLREADLLRLITSLGIGTWEIVTHPGVTTPRLRARYRWDYEWSQELTALTSPRTIAAIRSHSVQLARFSQF